MTEIRRVPRDRLGSALGLVNDNGDTSRRGVAALIREAIHRWRIADRGDVLRYVRKQLNLVGVEDKSIAKEILDELSGLGDIGIGRVGTTEYVFPSEPRWLATGLASGVVLGLRTLPDTLDRVESAIADDLLLRFELDDEAMTGLKAAGVRHVLLRDWLDPLQWSTRWRAPEDRERTPRNLETFWSSAVKRLGDSGLPVGEDAEVRVVSGAPGEFFGRFGSPEPEGRWETLNAEGLWLGVRRGFNQAHWHPVLVRVEDGHRTMLDLFDFEELWWLVIARSQAMSEPEIVRRDGARVQFTFPLPAQLRSAMNLLGPPGDVPWSWTVEPEVELPHEIVLSEASSKWFSSGVEP